GRCVAEVSRRLPVRHTPGGGREIDAGSLDTALDGAFSRLRLAVGGRWRRVSGVGVAAQGGSTMMVERDSGRAVSPMYLWNDARASGWVSRLAVEHGKAFWRRLFGFDMPPTGLGRIAWLREQRPELFNARYLHAGAGEYLFRRLTGIWRQDAGNAIQAGSYNARTRRLDGTALELVGVSLDFVAPLRQGHETAQLDRDAARKFKLAEGIAVTGPYIDQEASYLSAAGAGSNPLQVSMGTAWVGNFSIPQGMTGSSPSQLVLPPLLDKSPFVIQPLYAGNSTWDWALETFAGRPHSAALRAAAGAFARAILPHPGLVCIPYCAQQNPLRPDQYGGGVYLGVGTGTSRSDFLRATAVGLVCELGRVFAGLASSGAVDAVVLGGGASRGAYFRQLSALAFGRLPVLWQSDYNLSAARGSLFALSPRASGASQFKRVDAPAELAEPFRRAFEIYESAFDEVYGRNPDLRPYACRAK
ncbi:MAG: FGGY family carbohydrate kinase, partial [Candidatus Hydrogenedentes bacterium]|nr:FGGY family carbohydrate kinase [Candidatus Hydrogenedentota bacterium]